MKFKKFRPPAKKFPCPECGRKHRNSAGYCPYCNSSPIIDKSISSEAVLPHLYKMQTMRGIRGQIKVSIEYNGSFKD